jgi:methanethiol S-methyltransferase
MSRSSRLLVLAYAAAAYAVFLLSAAWAIGFLADRWAPTTVDGGSGMPAAAALAIDAALLLAFAAPHSVLARPAVKRVLARWLPTAAIRSTYVLQAGLLLMLAFASWQPVPITIWRVGEPWAAVLWSAYAAGWVLVIASTFMVDHWDFIGLRQAWAHARRSRYAPPAFTERWLYAVCRHPMMLGLLVAFWATPDLTVGHAAFAAVLSAYIAIGIRWEERDLHAELGEDYHEYSARVPAVIPAVRPGGTVVRT